MSAHSVSIDPSVRKARLAPLFFACLLALPATFAGWLTLGFCGFAWGCFKEESLLFALPAILISIWMRRAGPILLWSVVFVGMLRFLPFGSFSVGLFTIFATLIVAALLTQFASSIAWYLAGEKGELAP